MDAKVLYVQGCIHPVLQLGGDIISVSAGRVSGQSLLLRATQYRPGEESARQHGFSLGIETSLFVVNANRYSQKETICAFSELS